MYMEVNTMGGQVRESGGYGTIAVFLFVGIASTLVDVSLLWLFTAYFGVWYLTSAATSYCCGTVTSYCLNKHLTFHDRSRDYVSQFSRFTAVSVLCLAVTLCIVWAAVELLGLNYLVAKIGAAFCAFFLNYFGQSRITFRLEEVA
jgi:putative flippase GtrA